MSQQQQQLTATMGTGSQSESEPEANVGEQSQLVPVSEAIKYRKRAQAAEQQVEQLTGQLEQQQERHLEVKASLDEAQLEMELTQQLAKAGVIDVEAALLLAQKKMKTSDGNNSDTQQFIEALRSERPYPLISDAQQICGQAITKPPRQCWTEYFRRRCLRP